MKHIKTRVIILKRLNFGEADRILTALSEEYGRVSLLAKGVRKSNSKLAGGLELFSVCDVTYIEGRSELKTLISTRLKDHFSEIVKDINKTMLAYEFFKALEKATQHGTTDGTYAMLENILVYLNQPDSDSNLANIWLISHLLQAEGSGINLEKPLNSAKFSEEQLYDFNFEDMAFYVSNNGTFTPKHIKFLKLVARGSTPSNLHVVTGFEALSADLNNVFSNLLRLHKA